MPTRQQPETNHQLNNLLRGCCAAFNNEPKRIFLRELLMWTNLITPIIITV